MINKPSETLLEKIFPMHAAIVSVTKEVIMLFKENVWGVCV